MSQIDIKIDPSWKLSAQQGDTLELTTQIAVSGTESMSASHVIPVAQSLGFPPEKIFKHLKKSIGQKVFSGDVIAEKDGMFSSRKFVSKFTGTIISVDHHKGEIVIEEQTENDNKSQVFALVNGKIAKITDDKINVKTGQAKELDIQGETVERFGAKFIATDTTRAILLTLPEVKDVVIFVPDISDYVISKLGALGAKYIITNVDFPESRNVITLSDKSAENIRKLLEFTPKFVYAESRETKLIFYKSE